MSTASEPGAPPAHGMIPLCVPEIRGNEWEYIKDCLDTNWVSSVGSYVDRFEEGIASYIGTKHGVATSSGTAALHLALLVSGIQPGDEVLVSTLSFIAPANAVRYVGAWPVFVDSEPSYWQMDPDKLLDFIENKCQRKNGNYINRKTNRPVKAILPVHILGHPCHMQAICEIARRYELLIIEDATESLGAKYQDHMVGNLGDIACLSFNGNKLISTGGGGMLVSDNAEFIGQAKYLSTQAKDDPIEYVHNTLGYNYRLTNIQAAMGCAQLESLDSYISIKQSNAQSYTEALVEIPGITPMAEAPWARSVFWLYTVLLDEEQYGTSSRDMLKRFESAGIQTRPLWQPLHQSPAHQGAWATDCSVAERLSRQALSLPSSVGLNDEDQRRVIRELVRGYEDS